MSQLLITSYVHVEVYQAHAGIRLHNINYKNAQPTTVIKGCMQIYASTCVNPLLYVQNVWLCACAGFHKVALLTAIYYYDQLYVTAVYSWCGKTPTGS